MDKGLFYEAISRRPLIDVVAEQDEIDFNKAFIDSSNDITLYSWRGEWLKNLKLNKDYFGYFNREHSIKVFANELLNRPCILVGAGPSLQENIEQLRLAKQLGIKIVACNHSFMYLADYDIKPDFVVMLDAGEHWDEYVKSSDEFKKGIPLFVDQVCKHDQIKEWSKIAPVYFFRSENPKESNIGKYLLMEINRIATPYESGSTISVGGHVVAAMTSIVNGLFNSTTLIYCGNDYAFSPHGKFYPFGKKIDEWVTHKTGEVTAAPPGIDGAINDIFGNPVPTGRAYLGFKNTMDMATREIAIATGKDIVNASEGGAFGALVGGNSRWLRYLTLDDAIWMAHEKEKTRVKNENSEMDTRTVNKNEGLNKEVKHVNDIERHTNTNESIISGGNSQSMV